MRILIILFLALSVGFELLSQATFSDKQFFEIILKNHPLAKQAQLQTQFGEKEILYAQGGFDPKIFTHTLQKNFNSTSYYNLIHSGLKIPTWYGLEFKGGFESNQGAFLNPEEKTPSSGLVYAGASVNLGKGLFIDQRRAELFKAKVYYQSTFFEQKLQLNELIYESGYAYWSWFLSYHSMKILDEAFQLANIRYDAVKRSAELEDRPEIDVVEAGLQVQNRESMLRNYEAEYKGSGFKISTFLWNEQQVPLDLDSLTTPMKIEILEKDSVTLLSNQEIDTALANHPYIQVTNFKIKGLEIERKLKKEQLKPELAVNYNFLNQPIQNNPFANLSMNNYKWGLTFEMPILLRKERGDLAKTNLKLKEEQFNLENSKAYVEYKIRNAYVDYNNALIQVEIFQKTVVDTKRLLDAEKAMFESGESSLFLINARELAYIQAKLKWVESIAKSKQAYLSLKFNLAQLI
jgi:outer membrane protein TolC